jgi:hypothetical protein
MWVRTVLSFALEGAWRRNHDNASWEVKEPDWVAVYSRSNAHTVSVSLPATSPGFHMALMAGPIQQTGLERDSRCRAACVLPPVRPESGGRARAQWDQGLLHYETQIALTTSANALAEVRVWQRAAQKQGTWATATIDRRLDAITMAVAKR